MLTDKIHLLDCTLRDGGYVNDWRFGFDKARGIIKYLSMSGVEVIEVGFLRNIEKYNADSVVSNFIEELNGLLPNEQKDCMYSAMAMCSNYDVNQLSAYSGAGIELIRVTAHKYDIEDGLKFSQIVKEKGYKVSINPINIMGYSDEELIDMIKKVNVLQPYQFSIVDTFGSMKRRDLDRIVSLVDNNLNSNIRLGLHLHENMSLSCCLAQNFIDKHLQRSITIDGSLIGMGRIPGNLPLELIADYVNDYFDKKYDIDYMMDAINDYILPLKGESNWGYTPAYFLSAKYNLHRNYAEYYLEKGDLTNRDINKILASFSNDKKSVFDKEYAKERYYGYKNNYVNDDIVWEELRKAIAEHTILVIAPGASIKIYGDLIRDTIREKEPIVISINFIPKDINVDYAFFSNSKRYNLIDKYNCKTIVTSNLSAEGCDYKINYYRVVEGIPCECNGFLMLLKMLKEMSANCVYVAGADGYQSNRENYYTNAIDSKILHDESYNLVVKDTIYQIGMKVEYITPSEYE